MIPANRAVDRTSPFLIPFSRTSAKASAPMYTRPLATASREVVGFSPTFTIDAAPVRASTCVSVDVERADDVADVERADGVADVERADDAGDIARNTPSSVSFASRTSRSSMASGRDDDAYARDSAAANDADDNAARSTPRASIRLVSPR